MRKRKGQDNLRIHDAVEEILNRVTLENKVLQDIENDSYALGIISKADLNRFYNVYINNATHSLERLQKFNVDMLEKVIKKKNIMSPSDYAKMWVRLKELEFDHLKVINEIRKSQEFTLEQSEREILIIYRSLTPELKTYFYKVILEFIKQCPEIQKAMLQTNQKIMEENPQIKEEIEKQKQETL